MTSDDVLTLQGILIRILNGTDYWPSGEKFELTEAGKAEDAKSSGIPGWNTAGHHAMRLARFNFRKLDPDIFKPSPVEWWRAMRDAANNLVLYRDVIPLSGLVQYRLTLLSGLGDVHAAWDDAYSQENPEPIVAEANGKSANSLSESGQDAQQAGNDPGVCPVPTWTEPRPITVPVVEKTRGDKSPAETPPNGDSTIIVTVSQVAEIVHQAESTVRKWTKDWGKPVRARAKTGGRAPALYDWSVVRSYLCDRGDIDAAKIPTLPPPIRRRKRASKTR